MSDFGAEVQHDQYERDCARLERTRWMFAGAVSGTATLDDWQRWCEQSAWSRSSWIALADGFVRRFDWGWDDWNLRCDALEELARLGGRA